MGTELLIKVEHRLAIRRFIVFLIGPTIIDSDGIRFPD